MDEPANLTLAADFYNRYPGELVNLYLQFTAPSQPGITLQVDMPNVMQAETFRLPEGVPSSLPVTAISGEDALILIPLQGYFQPGESYEIQIGTRVNTFYTNQYLSVESRLVGEDASVLGMSELRLTVHGSGKYLENLPEIYGSDDFTSRFMMLFESIWKPISQQIDQIENYFDPNLTPPAFVPWLASWVGMPVDPFLPLDRVRALLRNALVLFQTRGTRHALQTYLEIYTAGQAHIIERRASNLVLGSTAILGRDVALGKDNQPNAVDIHLKVAQAELDRTRFTPETYHQKINELVRALVPAHVHYTINCEFTQESA